MIIELKKFGVTLISRQTGREAFSAINPVLKDLKDDEITFYQDGDFIQSADPADFSRAFENGISAVDSFYKNLKEVEETKLFERLSNTAKSLNDVIEEIKSGKGMLHAMIYEPEG